MSWYHIRKWQQRWIRQLCGQSMFSNFAQAWISKRFLMKKRQQIVGHCFSCLTIWFYCHTTDPMYQCEGVQDITHQSNMLQSSQVAKGTLVFGEGLAADTDAVQQSIKENRPRDCVEEPGTVVCVSGQELTRRRPQPTRGDPLTPGCHTIHTQLRLGAEPSNSQGLVFHKV